MEKRITTILEYKAALKTQDLILVDIRSGKNMFSSDDIMCHLGPKIGLKSVLDKIVNDFNKNNLRVNNEEIEYKGTKYNVTTLTLAPDRSAGEWDKETKLHYRNMFNKYGAFVDKYPQFYLDWRKELIDNKRTKSEQERKEKGYVIWKEYPNKHETKDYVGGFDLDIFFKEELISYVEQGLTAGYIGSRYRKVWVDKLMSKICLPAIKADDFACWLTSTAGRHFADTIAVFVENEDHNEVEKLIKKQLPIIHDQAVIYNHPDHKGNLSSAIQLWDKLSDLGMMMCKQNPFKF